MTEEEKRERKRQEGLRYYYANKHKFRERYLRNREAVLARSRERYLVNRDRELERRKRYREENSELIRARSRQYHRTSKYGLSQLEYDSMLATQGGLCAICKARPHGGRGGVLCIDHDHATGRVRGLLCHYCNMVVGYAKDDATLLLSMVRYLRGS